MILAALNERRMDEFGTTIRDRRYNFDCVRYSHGKAIVLSNAFSAWRESSRVCCTTTGTSDSIKLA
jgi:hypothetical protein